MPSQKIKLSYTKRTYSKEKFLEMIEKRIRKDLRTNKYLKPKEEVYLLNDGTKEYKTAKFFLKRIFGKYLKLKETKRMLKKKIIIPTNLDREVKEKLEAFIKGKPLKRGKKEIRILHNVLEEEINHIYRGKKEPKNPLIEQLEQKYPGIKFSLLRGLETLEKL
jgi:hypothetical protein